MRVRPRFLPLCLLPFVVNGCATTAPEQSMKAVAQAKQALGGIEGTFEYALDAPWRIEPVIDSTGKASYGHVPIQISIHDANMTAADRGSLTSDGAERHPGNFCQLSVDEEKAGVVYRTGFGFTQLTEVESTTGAWKPDGTTPPHQVCKPGTGACGALQNIGPTSEWHAGAWYKPTNTLSPGADLPLVLRAKISRRLDTDCNDPDDSKFYTLTNHVRVHFGEAPLPRFDNGWLYGDLHHHSQGTDNEGEAGYHWIDPTGLLRVPVMYGWSGKKSIELPISAFQAGNGRRPERMFVRAFAQTAQKDGAACANGSGKLTGACIRRYAYTNPIWTMNGPGSCPARPRALDRDGDAFPTAATRAPRRRTTPSARSSSAARCSPCRPEVPRARGASAPRAPRAALAARLVRSSGLQINAS